MRQKIMKKYHPIIAIILGNLIIGFLISFVRYLPKSYLADILTILILVLGGFAATYLSRTNRARMGFYNNLIYSVGSLMGLIFIFKTGLTIYSLLILFLVFPIFGLLGGFIAKKLRIRLDKQSTA